MHHCSNTTLRSRVKPFLLNYGFCGNFYLAVLQVLFSQRCKKLNGKQIYNKRFKDGKEKISTYKLRHILPLTQKFWAPKFKNSPTQDKPLMHQKTCLRYLQCTSICLCSLKTVHKHMLVHCNYLIHVFW